MLDKFAIGCFFLKSLSLELDVGMICWYFLVNRLQVERDLDRGPH